MKTKQTQHTIQTTIRAQVLTALGWDALQYGHYQWDKGVEFLRSYCGDDEEIIRLYEKHPMFWKWYINHWHARDAEFLIRTEGMSHRQKLSEYTHVHNMKGFRYRPHRAIMEQSMYDDVIYPSTHERVTI